MIFSEVGVTGFAALALDAGYAPEPECVGFPTGLRSLPIERNVFCFFVIT